MIIKICVFHILLSLYEKYWIKKEELRKGKVINKIYKIGWFSTGRDKAAGQLLKVIYDNIKKNKLPPHPSLSPQGRGLRRGGKGNSCTIKLKNLAISFVFSDRIKGEKEESDCFFRLVENLKINLVTFSSREFKAEMRKEGLKLARKGNFSAINHWRNLYHLEITKLINKFQVDLIVLAGYMLIVGRDLCHNYPMINLHPALPGGPRGTWQEVIWELIKQKARESGVMMHLVTSQLDAGPTLTYCSFSLEGDKFDSLWKKMEEKLKRKTLEKIKEEEGEEEPLFKKIREEGVKRELSLIAYTLKAISEGKIKLKEGKVILEGQEIDGYCLNEEIEKEVNAQQTTL